MENFIMSPKVDFALKEIMTNQNVLKGFLSAVLKIEFEDIVKATLLNTNLRKLHEDDKLGILDVRVELNSTIEIDIEIQVVKIEAWTERSLFYLAKLFTDQINKGDDYDDLKKCINISILDFKLFNDTDAFYSVFHLLEDNRHSMYTDKLEFHVIELPKLPKNFSDNEDDLFYWSKFINAQSEEEFKMIATKNPYINEALEELEKISQDKEKRYEYLQREKALRDSIYLENRRKKIEAELQIKSKKLESTEEKLEVTEEKLEFTEEKLEVTEEKLESTQNKLYQAIKKFLEMNLTYDEISKIVNLTPEEIKKIIDSQK
jgi:predicted transposase/invertase (TIGR01784 family)